jgi:hypothetical protein
MRKTISVALGTLAAATLLMIIAGNRVEAEKGLVVLDVMGPSSAVEPPGNLPANLTLRQQQYQLTNLSSQDILFYNIAFVGERGKIVAELGSASYPPDDPPLLGAGDSKTITRRYIDNADAAKVQAQIDSVVFADGSSYGPDALKRKAGYVASIETRYLVAQSILELLDTQGAEAVREYLMRILETPNDLMPMSAANAVKASRTRELK